MLAASWKPWSHFLTPSNPKEQPSSGLFRVVPGGQKKKLQGISGRRKHNSKLFENLFMMLKACSGQFWPVPGSIVYSTWNPNRVNTKTWNGPKQPGTGREHHKNILERLRVMFATSWNTMKPCFWPPGTPRNLPEQPSTGLFLVVPWGQKYYFLVCRKPQTLF